MSYFVARNRAQIRDAFLGNWRARYVARGLDLDVTEGGHAWMFAEALALELEGVEARALSLAGEILPDTASDAYVLRHAQLVGLDLKPAVAAEHSVTVTGAAASSWSTTDRLRASTGAVFRPAAGGSLGAGSGTVTGTLLAVALEPGTGGNLAAGAVLQWSAAPAGMDPAATVASTPTPGVDVESYRSLARRVLAWWRDRPACGNRADWRAWAEAVAGVDRAFVYPLLHPSLGAGTLGAVTVVCLGPSPSLVVGSGVTDEVHDYVEGEGDYSEQRRPVTMAVGDYSIEPAAPLVTHVGVSVVLGPGYSFPFPTSYAVATAANAHTLTLTSPPSDVSVGDLVAVQLSSLALARGGYALRHVTGVSGSDITLDADLPEVPGAGQVVLPACDNWQSIVDSLLAVFDSLGPGDSVAAPRWPATSAESPATLYHSALVAAVMGVPGLPSAPAGTRGVVSATIATPAGDVVPALKQLIVPGYLIVTP